jgi:hypothetical protein
MAELNGPRLEPRAGGPARQLVVFLHGAFGQLLERCREYGAANIKRFD